MAATEDEKTLIEILDDPSDIDPNKYMNYVRAPQSGAISTFAGTTRDSFEGKVVIELHYEAYVPMAIRRLRSICSSARSSWKVDSIAVAHRLGSVPVGETSVFVAVSAVHRSDAMEACQYVIDEIKASVPIWKKEVYANGEVWKENAEFLERRLGLEMGAHDKGSFCSAKVKVGSINEEAHDKSDCCGAKVKGVDEVAHNKGGCCGAKFKGVDEAAHNKGGCCGAKVKVGSVDEVAHDKGCCCGAKVKVGSVNEEVDVRDNRGGL